jgi:hypothetical protein
MLLIGAVESQKILLSALRPSGRKCKCSCHVYVYVLFLFAVCHLINNNNIHDDFAFKMKLYAQHYSVRSFAVV